MKNPKLNKISVNFKCREKLFYKLWKKKLFKLVLLFMKIIHSVAFRYTINTNSTNKN